MGEVGKYKGQHGGILGSRKERVREICAINR